MTEDTDERVAVRLRRCSRKKSSTRLLRVEQKPGRIFLQSSTGRIAAKRKTAGIKFTHRPKISFFSPRRGDSLHQFRSNFAAPTGTWVRLGVQNFTSIPTGVGMRPQKCQKIPLFGKESPRRGDSLDQFLKFLGAFIRINILH